MSEETIIQLADSVISGLVYMTFLWGLTRVIQGRTQATIMRDMRK